ncbi:haloacid dehalogenase-like hydrolase-like protein [Strigomonas culicis]|nr:haloacid dehalogenase-like hydrolase-like protein [Strigomonas culicis]|eukprot:EPY35571.1 haloacid dehalogenase-like hydrolase-like protein [Strigomonas culicis]
MKGGVFSMDISNIPRCFAITSNGSCIYNEANQKVYENPLDARVCAVLYNMFLDDPEVNINIFRTVTKEDRQRANYYNASDVGDKDEDKAYEEWVCRYPSEAEAALYSQTKFTYRVVTELEKHYSTDSVNCIFFLCYNLEKAKQVEEMIKEKIQELHEEDVKAGLNGRTFRVAPSAPYCLDIVSSNISKATALQHILRELNLTFDQVVTFGDGMNDIEMLSKAGRGFVMANANPRVKDLLLHSTQGGQRVGSDCKNPYYEELLSSPDAINNCEAIGTNDDESVALKLAELFHIDLSKYNDDWDTESVGSVAP